VVHLVELDPVAERPRTVPDARQDEVRLRPVVRPPGEQAPRLDEQRPPAVVEVVAQLVGDPDGRRPRLGG
jgi:hypothetical protein